MIFQISEIKEVNTINNVSIIEEYWELFRPEEIYKYEYKYF